MRQRILPRSAADIFGQGPDSSASTRRGDGDVDVLGAGLGDPGDLALIERVDGGERLAGQGVHPLSGDQKLAGRYRLGLVHRGLLVSDPHGRIEQSLVFLARVTIGHPGDVVGYGAMHAVDLGPVPRVVGEKLRVVEIAIAQRAEARGAPCPSCARSGWCSYMWVRR